ncbi:transporter substrate-binding domain-containing protein [Ruminococcus sp.]|uniref:transporter substrate-binding domain-containing protein n=1 Tax=Ruminococcus sp. TaxID=41978 RepID=UPI00292E70CE|nr:transporter substrate-binding domain-containing protein [uncultured Ruminococcus sp.]
MKKVLALILAVAMIASVAMLTACGGNNANKGNATDAKADADKTYIIYSDNAFAPFEYLDTETNAYVGVDMDIMAAIAEDQGIKYEMHNEGFDASMGAVQSGQADAMIAGMTITDERKETFDFSEPYFDDGQVIVAKAGTKMEDLKGKTVAAKTSTVGGEYAESIKDQYGFTINYYEGSDNMYQAVATGADVACVEDFSVIGYAIKTGQVNLEIISEEPANVKGYGFAVQKGKNAELIEKFNTGLANIKASGKYKEILAKYGY